MVNQDTITMILTSALPQTHPILFLDTRTLILARWDDATPEYLRIQGEEPPSEFTQKQFVDELHARHYGGRPPVIVTSACPVTDLEIVAFLGHGNIAAHHIPTTLTLVYGGTGDIPPMIRKPVAKSRESEIFGLVPLLVSAMNAAIGRTGENGIPVIPFYNTPRPIIGE